MLALYSSSIREKNGADFIPKTSEYIDIFSGLISIVWAPFASNLIALSIFLLIPVR